MFLNKTNNKLGAATEYGLVSYLFDSFEIILQNLEKEKQIASG
jgi:hypothetical protein